MLVVENAADDIWNSLELDTIVDLEAEKINSRDNYWLSSTLLTNRDGGAHESIGLCGHDIDDLPRNDMGFHHNLHSQDEPLTQCLRKKQEKEVLMILGDESSLKDCYTWII
ncbi:hypothetical protein ACP4OV_029025 [Aristida adscensionis]